MSAPTLAKTPEPLMTADHEDDEDAGRAWTPVAAAGAAPNRRQAAGLANRDEELEEGLDDEDDEEHDEHDDAPEERRSR